MTARTPLAAEHTHRVLAAQMTLGEMVATHRLVLTSATVAAGTLQRQPNGTTVLVGAPVITVVTTPRGFLDWCETLDVGQVLLQRSHSDIVALVGNVSHQAHQWVVRSTVARAESLRAVDDLPGAPIPWQHERARIGLARLTAGLTARGLA